MTGLQYLLLKLWLTWLRFKLSNTMVCCLILQVEILKEIFCSEFDECSWFTALYWLQPHSAVSQLHTRPRFQGLLPHGPLQSAEQGSPGSAVRCYKLSLSYTWCVCVNASLPVYPAPLPPETTGVFSVSVAHNRNLLCREVCLYLVFRFHT